MKIFKKYRRILLLIGISLIIRILIYLLIMDKGFFFDHYIFKEWAYKSYSVGLNLVYSTHSPGGISDVNQPPGTIYILRGSYEVFLLTARVLTHLLHLPVGSTYWLNDKLLPFFFRFLSIIADLILGFLIYFMVRSKTKEKIAFTAASLFLLGLPIIYNSTVWGQMDSLNNLFFYLSLMFLMKKQALISILCFAASLFIKLSLLPLLPLYLLFALFGGFFKRISLVVSILITCVIIFIICLPFSNDPLWLISVVEKSASGINQDISVNAFNFWWLIFNPALHISPPAITSIFFGFSLNSWAYLIFVMFCLPIIYYSVRLIKIKELTTDTVFFLTTIAAFASFLFLPKMHERYLYPVFPLLITWIGLKNKYWMITALLSIIHFLNLYIVWNPKLFLFGNIEDIILSQNGKWLLSLITIFIFGFFYLKIFTNLKMLFKSTKEVVRKKK